MGSRGVLASFRYNSIVYRSGLLSGRRVTEAWVDAIFTHDLTQLSLGMSGVDMELPDTLGWLGAYPSVTKVYSLEPIVRAASAELFGGEDYTRLC